MNGFLDQLSNLSPDQTQGLLSAAAALLQAGGPSRTPISTGQAFGSGLQAFQQGLQGSQDRNFENTLRKLKLTDITSDLQNQEDARKRARSLAEFQAKRGSSISLPPGMTNLAPTVENAKLMQAANAAAPDLYARMIADAQALENAGFAPEADAAYQRALKFKDEYDPKPQVGIGPDGKPFQYLTSKGGGIKRLEGILPRDEAHFVTLGDRVEAASKYAAPGTSFKMGEAPGSAANRAQAERHFQAAQNVPQYMDTSEGLVALPKRLTTGQAPQGQLVVGPSGAPLEKKQNVPQYVVEGVVNNAKSLASIDAALKSLNTPEGANAVGFKGYLPNSILNRAYPEGTETRANISDVGSLVLHDRSGAAVTAAESPRLMPFIPLATDDAETAKKKLTRFKQAFEAETNNLTFQFPGAKKLAEYASKNADSSQQLSDQGAQPNASRARPTSANIPQGAANLLKMNPKLRDQFDAKYGAGAAASILGQ